MDNEKIIFPDPRLLIKLSRFELTKDTSPRQLHFHSAIELVRADEGEILCTVSGKEIILSPGNILFINRLAVHQLAFYKNDAKITYMQIDINNYAKQFISSDTAYLISLISTFSDYIICDSNHPFFHIFCNMESEIIVKDTAYDSCLIADILHIIAIMQRIGLYPADTNLSIKSRLDKIMPAIRYVADNYSKDCMLSDVCRAINMDRFYFCKLFKKITGVGFTDYVNFVRLSNSERLLISTDSPVSQIAFECGFSSIQHFNRLFKLRRGCTPKEYRKLNSSVF